MPMTIESLTTILRCPASGGTLRRSGETLVAADGTTYPIVQGIPVFTPAGRDTVVHPADHLSNSLAPDAVAVATGTTGLVLNLSAGGSGTKLPNVVELEYSIFRNTDVVGDAHRLPFADNVFAGCICMNAFEHYRSPKDVAAEILRVLQPGGTFLMHTADLQPLHEAPHHYFNATCFGVAEWLSGFAGVELTVSPNFNPVFALSWLASELQAGVAAHQGPAAARIFETSTLHDVLTFWRNPEARSGRLWQVFQNLDQATQRTCAAGWQARAVKPVAGD
ncbi:MAG: methyltransferase domain-containing protein [Planctomycetia bacterium]